jgi:hypothetical protein
VHIFTASRQPWVVLPPGTPAFPVFYERETVWSRESLARLEAVQAPIEAWQAARDASGPEQGWPDAAGVIARR